MRAVVVGGGVFGLSSALALAERGHEVVVVARRLGPRARGASDDLNKAVRPDYGADGFYVDLGLAALDRWEAWNERAGEPLYNPTGMLFLTRRPLAPGMFEHDSLTSLEARGVAVQRLGPSDLAQRFPAFARGGFADGYLNPRAGWAAAARTVAVLDEWAQASGVVRLEDRALRLLGSNSRVTGVALASGTQVDADAVLVAAGAWTPALVPELQGCMWPTIQPVFLLRAQPAADFSGERFPVWAADIAVTGWYGFPATPAGELKLANHGPGTPVAGELGEDLDGIAFPDVRAFLAGAIPSLAAAPEILRRGCAYCDTFDGDFWIDRHPARDGLVVAAGGSGHAFKFAPLVGEIAADAVEGQANPWAHRFRWRSPGGAARSEGARARTGDPASR